MSWPNVFRDTQKVSGPVLDRCERSERYTAPTRDICVGDWICPAENTAFQVLSHGGYRTVIDGKSYAGFYIRKNGKVVTVDLDDSVEHTVMEGYVPAELRAKGMDWVDVLGLNRNLVLGA